MLVGLCGALPFLAGCSGDAEETSALEVAAQALDEAISDGTRVSGFTISEHQLRIVIGEPPERMHLHPEPARGRSPVTDPAHPPWVRGSEFPLEESLGRARDLVEQCEGHGIVDVRALSASAVTTRSICEDDKAVFLNGKELPGIDDAISSHAVTQLWSDIEAAGLGERIGSVEIDRDADIARVQFPGSVPERKYEWTRGLGTPETGTLSHPEPNRGEFSLDEFPATAAVDEFETLVGSVEDPEMVERILIAADGNGVIHMTLEALDHTELAAAAVGG